MDDLCYFLSVVSPFRSMMYDAIGECAQAERIYSGMTNENFKVTAVDGKKYKVRIPGSGTNSFINRFDEYKNMCAVQPLGINVRTVYFDISSGFKITQFVRDNFQFNFRINRTDSIIKVAKVLLKLHSADIVFDNVFNPLAKIEQYQQVCCQMKIMLDVDYAAVKERIYRVNDFLISIGVNSCPTHNDPVPENFLSTENDCFFLIDWEYSGMNDPVWDLASFTLEAGLSVQEEKLLLSAYYDQDPNNRGRVKMLIYKVYQDFLWYIWARIKMALGENLSGYAYMRYSRAKDNLILLENFISIGEIV